VHVPAAKASSPKVPRDSPPHQSEHTDNTYGSARMQQSVQKHIISMLNAQLQIPGSNLKNAWKPLDETAGIPVIQWWQVCVANSSNCI